MSSVSWDECETNGGENRANTNEHSWALLVLGYVIFKINPVNYMCSLALI